MEYTWKLIFYGTFSLCVTSTKRSNTHVWTSNTDSSILQYGTAYRHYVSSDKPASWLLLLKCAPSLVVGNTVRVDFVQVPESPIDFALPSGEMSSLSLSAQLESGSQLTTLGRPSTVAPSVQQLHIQQMHWPGSVLSHQEIMENS